MQSVMAKPETSGATIDEVDDEDEEVDDTGVEARDIDLFFAGNFSVKNQRSKASKTGSNVPFFLRERIFREAVRSWYWEDDQTICWSYMYTTLRSLTVYEDILQVCVLPKKTQKFIWDS